MGVRNLVAAGDDDAAAGPAWASDATVVAALGDLAVGACGTSGNGLPDDFAVVAETEL
jgi:hypothetical protein